jgi:hypothetical protein
MPQKPHRCQRRALKSYQKILRIILRLRHKKYLQSAVKSSGRDAQAAFHKRDSENNDSRG